MVGHGTFAGFVAYDSIYLMGRKERSISKANEGGSRYCIFVIRMDTFGGYATVLRGSGGGARAVGWLPSSWFIHRGA